MSFILGRRVGRSGLTTYGPRLGFTEPRLSRVDAFFARYGPKAILIGRFIGVIRAIAPFLAGSTGMRLRAFAPWSLLGTAAWSASFVLVGYVFSASVDSATRVLANGALGFALVAAVILTVRARRRSQQSLPGSDEGDPRTGNDPGKELSARGIKSPSSGDDSSPG